MVSSSSYRPMKIHFIGIGGIGVSALAGYYLNKGNMVSGSDLASSEITKELEKAGAKIFTGKHNANNIPKDADMVIYSPAVKKNNPELKQAKKFSRIRRDSVAAGQVSRRRRGSLASPAKRGGPRAASSKLPAEGEARQRRQVLSYPEALGELTKKYFTIAVSGAHGKSTTTAMLSLILEKAGFDPTVIIGTKLKEFNGRNYRVGKSEYLVIEADEWNRSFLNYEPKIIVLTNIDKEHLDTYKNIGGVIKTFKEYIGHLPETGILVANDDNKNIAKLIGSNKLVGNLKNPSFRHGYGGQVKIKKYSLQQKEAGIIKKILKIPGEHNISNALAALTASRELGVPDDVSLKALSEYHGAWRRFEKKEAKFADKKITIINDYGHHPTEVEATLKASREKFPNKKILCVFQPHQYQRTFYLFNEFVKVFSSCAMDKVIITDIYSVAGREKQAIKRKVDSQKLVKAISKTNIIYLPRNKIKEYLKRGLKGGEVFIIMGAGDIYGLF